MNAARGHEEMVGRLKLDRSVVVPDLSWLLARTFDHECLSNRHDYLFSEVAFREAVTATSDADGRTAKLTRIFRKNAARILVGRYWWDLHSREPSPTSMSSLADAVHPSLTHDIRDMPSVAESVYRSRARDLIAVGPDAAYERYRQWTIDIAESFVAWVRVERPEALRQIQEGGTLRDTVREPTIVVEPIAKGFIECASNEWREALGQFPDRLAIGRWYRLTIWIAHEGLRRNSLPLGHEMRNFFDDAHYAFLASYAGTLVTGDKGLARMTADVFPSVRVLQDLPDKHWQFDP